MYDKFKSYAKNHDTKNAIDVELKKITNEKSVVQKARKKIAKHKLHNVQNANEYYDKLLQTEYEIQKAKGNIKTHKKRLKNFRENGHID